MKNKIVKKFKHFIWTDITKPNSEQLAKLDVQLGLEPHLIEDVLEHGHLPKIEKFSNTTFIILRAYTANVDKKATSLGDLSGKIAFFYNESELLSLHRMDFDFINAIEYKAKSSELLALRIIKNILMTYTKPVRLQSDKIDKFEQEIFLKDENAISIEDLYFQKSKARLSKKILLLTQNVLNQFVVKKENKSILQDLKETLTKNLLLYEDIIEDSKTLLNSYLAFKAQKSNDVMKLLTVFSAFFLPLSFLVGVYGMNFTNMHELKFEYGYFMLLGIMLLIAIVIYFWFKRKNIM